MNDSILFCNRRTITHLLRRLCPAQPRVARQSEPDVDVEGEVSLEEYEKVFSAAEACCEGVVGPLLRVVDRP